MSRLPLTLLISLLLLVAAFATGVSAQDDSAACSSDMLVMFSANAEYAAACEAFRACYETVGDFVPCTPHFLVERQAVCETDTSICSGLASHLQTALIGLYQSNGYQAQQQTPAFWIDLATRLLDTEQLLAAIEHGDAEEWFAPLVDDYREHPMLSYIFAKLASFRADTETAELYLETAQLQNSADPLVYLEQREIAIKQGVTDTAAVAHALFAATVGAPKLHAGVQALIDSQAAFDLSEAMEMLLYPETQYGGGPGGNWRADLSLTPPRSIRLLHLGAYLLFIDDTAVQREENENRLTLPFYPLIASGETQYQWSGYDYYAGTQTRITFEASSESQPMLGSRSDIVFEGSSTTTFQLVLLGEADPRPQGFRCEGAPQTRLADSEFITPFQWSMPIVLHNEPAGDVTAELEPEMEQLRLAVSEGPKCRDGFTWYRVVATQNGVETSGWLAENADETHYDYDDIADD